MLWGACDPLFTPAAAGPVRRHRPARPAASCGDAGRGRREAVPGGARRSSARRGRGAGTVIVLRGPALGRRGDARRAEPARPPDRVGAGAGGRHLPRRRAGPWPPAAPAARRAARPARSAGSPTEPLSAGGGRGARRAVRPGRGRAAPRHRPATRSSSPRCSRPAASDIPATVRDAVLARAARLERRGDRASLEAVSVAVPHAELWLLDALAPDAAAGLEQCLRAGHPRAVARRASRSATSWPGSRSRSRWRRTAGWRLHRRALAALHAGRRVDLARLAHHAEAAGDTEAVLRHAPAAAAARRLDRGPPRGGRPVRAGAAVRRRAAAATRGPTLLEGRSYECYLTDQTDASIDALQEADRGCAARPATGCGEGDGAVAAVAPAVVRRAQRRRRRGRAGGGAAARRACRPGRSWRSRTATSPRSTSTRSASTRPSTGAPARSTSPRQLGDTGGGRAQPQQPRHDASCWPAAPEGREQLERSLALAERGRAGGAHRPGVHPRRLGDDPDPGVRPRALARPRRRACARTSAWRRWKLYVLAVPGARPPRPRPVGRGRRRTPTFVLRIAPSPCRCCGSSRSPCSGWSAPGAAIRDPWPLLDEARALTRRADELQYLRAGGHRPGRGGVAGRRRRRRRRGDPATCSASAIRRRARPGWSASWPGCAGWPGCRCRTRTSLEPYAAQLAGDGRRRRRGVGPARLPVRRRPRAGRVRRTRTACAAPWPRSSGSAPGPAAAIVARRLRERGVRGLPRGPRRATRANPAGLTRAGGRGAGAAPGRPVERRDRGAAVPVRRRRSHHHVSAILRKLGVARRGQAAAEAARLGLPTASQI